MSIWLACFQYERRFEQNVKSVCVLTFFFTSSLTSVSVCADSYHEFMFGDGAYCAALPTGGACFDWSFDLLRLQTESWSHSRSYTDRHFSSPALTNKNTSEKWHASDVSDVSDVCDFSDVHTDMKPDVQVFDGSCPDSPQRNSNSPTPRHLPVV